MNGSSPETKDSPMKASSAIRRGELPPPPMLTDGMIEHQACLAAEHGARLAPVSLHTRYANTADSPVLLIDGRCMFELLDEWEPEAGTARMAASKGAMWFRVAPEGEDNKRDDRFLTWHYIAGVWWLFVAEQYIA